MDLLKFWWGIRYLILIGPEKYDAICNRIRYFISQKSDITYVVSDNYAKIKINSYDSLALEKSLTLRIVIILIKSVFNKDKNHYYYYYVFLEEFSYKYVRF